MCAQGLTHSHVAAAGRGRFHQQAEAYSVEEEAKISVYVTAELCKCQALSKPDVEWEMQRLQSSHSKQGGRGVYKQHRPELDLRRGH